MTNKTNNINIFTTTEVGSSRKTKIKKVLFPLVRFSLFIYTHYPASSQKKINR